MDNANTITQDVVLDKKLSEYGRNDDFIASQEITVTITLREYRELVSNNATREHEISKANSDKYERETQIKTLEQRVKALEDENYSLKKKLENFELSRSCERPSGDDF